MTCQADFEYFHIYVASLLPQQSSKTCPETDAFQPLLGSTNMYQD